MRKLNKIDYIMLAALAVVMFFVFLFLFCFVFNSERSVKLDLSENQKSKNSFLEAKRMEENYKKEIINLMKKYFSLENKDALNKKNVLSLQDKFLDMTVPNEYKDLHLNIFLALEKMISAFDNDSDEEILEARTIIREEAENSELLREIISTS